MICRWGAVGCRYSLDLILLPPANHKRVFATTMVQTELFVWGVLIITRQKIRRCVKSTKMWSFIPSNPSDNNLQRGPKRVSRVRRQKWNTQHANYFWSTTWALYKKKKKIIRVLSPKSAWKCNLSSECHQRKQDTFTEQLWHGCLFPDDSQWHHHFQTNTWTKYFIPLELLKPVNVLALCFLRLVP